MNAKQLTFTFYYVDESHALPTGIGIHPDINNLHDVIVLFIATTLTRVLSKRHGLEQALKMMQDAGYGKIGENATFRMRWSTQKEMEGRFGDLSLDEDEYNGM